MNRRERLEAELSTHGVVYVMDAAIRASVINAGESILEALDSEASLKAVRDWIHGMVEFNKIIFRIEANCHSGRTLKNEGEE